MDISWNHFKFAAHATPGQMMSAVGLSYCLGCIATGYYLFRFVARKDIRQEGSGNTGARNVGRLLGPWGFAAVLLLDLGKGALAVWVGRRIGGDVFSAVLALLAVTIGHIWPVQLRFRGGKGVSPSLGGLLVLDYRLALTFAALAAVGWVGLRNFTLSGLLAFAMLPLVAWQWRQTPEVVLGLGLLAALVLFAHRKNIGEELLRLASRRASHKLEPKV